MLFVLGFALFSFLCSIPSEGKTFGKVFYCMGGDGCSWDKEFFTLRASDIHLQSLSVRPSSISEVPLSVRCAYWCQLNSSCLAFNYGSVSEICYFFATRSYKIYPKENCLYYEAVKDVYSSPQQQKTCQSSAVIQSGVVLGTWEMMDFDLTCSQTAEPPTGSNWWMIDMEQFITLIQITILAGSWNSISRLDGVIVGITNTSWLVGQPVRGNYTVCAVLTDRPLMPYSYHKMNCKASIVPGRYVIVQQGELDPSTLGQFALCGLRFTYSI